MSEPILRPVVKLDFVSQVHVGWVVDGDDTKLPRRLNHHVAACGRLGVQSLRGLNGRSSNGSSSLGSTASGGVTIGTWTPTDALRVAFLVAILGSLEHHHHQRAGTQVVQGVRLQTQDALKLPPQDVDRPALEVSVRFQQRPHAQQQPLRRTTHAGHGHGPRSRGRVPRLGRGVRRRRAALPLEGDEPSPLECGGVNVFQPGHGLC
mmetsp:Transcript_76298/g.205828  ORF Transcript_76298/g.205828 Transcript_76298/m.205828 type:complete len:206 (+) Transcript_76298:216-833(+)